MFSIEEYIDGQKDPIEYQVHYKTRDEAEDVVYALERNAQLNGIRDRTYLVKKSEGVMPGEMMQQMIEGNLSPEDALTSIVTTLTNLG